MKIFIASTVIIALSVANVMAQTDNDPVVMRVNGKPVTRSEFEYNYNKNNTDGVVDKKTVEEYAELFANYKLKVEAALDAHLDTLSSFQQEFRTYRDQQIRPMLVPQSVMDNECRAYYQRMVESLQGHDLVQPAHIFLRLAQTASKEEQDSLKQRIDSIYAALRDGADFAELAKKHSQDPQTAIRGGLLAWIGPNQTLKEFEDVAYSLEVGQVSEPFLSTVGYHIVKLLGRKPLESYEELRPNIARYLESQGIQDKLAAQLLDSLSAHSNTQKSVEQILDEETERLCAENSDLKYLVQEYHDGLLLFEECNREVWEAASKDTTGIAQYFKKHRKDYAWDKPHFRGMIYYCRQASDVKAVKKALKKVDEKQWTSTARDRFNKDSVTVRMEYRMFVLGENPNVDVLAFKAKNVEQKLVNGFPYAAILGKVLKKGPAVWTDVSNQITSDYLHMREEEFVAKLRQRYTVEIDKEALKTVNNH
ncbi:MAG: peptidylprolyl isomerase [Bacteroidaceae bacterium]|nr:peptidylprolyl isomerase [Bacteroidaceae bacterium]